jgi:prepilin signal peptidase PulO-like enzyme (type II secretory pathway)
MNLSIENAFAPPLPVACAFMGIVGAMIGSFLNVVIHRLPRGQSIVFPNSTCPKCRKPIKPYDNIPILSFLILRGRCRACGAPISPRYPAVEALTGLLFAAVTWHDGWSLALGFDLAFAAALLALVFIDAEHMILPNAITYPGILFALIARGVVPYLAGPAHFDDLPQLITLFPPNYPAWLVSLIGAVLGALAGGGSLWLMGFLWERLRCKDDVHGGSIPGLAADYSHDSHCRAERFVGWNFGDVAARQSRPADDVAIRNFSGRRIDSVLIDRHAHHRMVCISISVGKFRFDLRS